MEQRDIPISEFRRFYDRGDLPIKMDHTGIGNKVVWKIPCEKLGNPSNPRLPPLFANIF